MMEDIYLAVLFIAVFGFLGFKRWLRFKREMTQKEMMFEAEKRVLDKLGSGAEVVEFLRSTEGREFFERLKEGQQEKTKTDPVEVAGGLMIGGLVAGFVGVAFLVSAVMIDEAFVIPGAICLLVGIALFSAPRLNYLLFRRWGWIRDDASRTPESKDS